AALAEEVFMTIRPEVIRELLGLDLCNNDWTPLMQTIGRSIRLDVAVATRLFRTAIAVSPDGVLGLHGLREALLSANPCWPERDDDQLYEQFLIGVAGPIEVHPCRGVAAPVVGGIRSTFVPLGMKRRT